MLYFIEKKDGNLIQQYRNGNKKNIKNNREERNINIKEELKVIFILYYYRMLNI